MPELCMGLISKMNLTITAQINDRNGTAPAPVLGQYRNSNS